ncbi:MAG: DUF2098 domain-containing protein [Methanomicrobiaceae archaeon]|uniref:DUF2098 domain-containing protein n=1 Tax=hydrocarbon metagenome TaxID=938273 RepID=A0A0W8FKA8_9ZZZZ|nr:DUF2098 domain-containing protein [Methanomicrobiaceae archaeon]MDD5420201.1 DUF2098 domain-containing protein [Methanomicrobiaceae archaeon]
MDASDVATGALVRYPRTGTTGKVLRVTEIDGCLFAELDSTHLLYRVDMLVEAGSADEKRAEERIDLLEYAEKEEEVTKTLEEAWMTTDQSCEGGG